jgi:uncharacterized membrane protein YfcA
MEQMALWLEYAGIGGLVGVLAGLLGIGGGGIMVPVLASLFENQGIGREIVVHLAVGTSMATILFTSMSSVRAHHLRGAVHWKALARITPGILVGGLAGSLGAGSVSGRGLALLFALVVCGVGMSMLLDRKPKPTRELPGPLGMFSAGAVISGVSSLMAIGGAAMTVPFMIFCNIPPIQAVGTASAIGFPIALSSTIGYVVTGLGAVGLPTGSLGYVYLPALVGISVASMMTAPLGARLAHRLPTKRLRQVFAVVLFLLAARMVWKLWG